jgi:hypothetical protein
VRVISPAFKLLALFDEQQPDQGDLNQLVNVGDCIACVDENPWTV